jgi:hypothetical protein
VLIRRRTAPERDLRDLPAGADAALAEPARTLNDGRTPGRPTQTAGPIFIIGISQRSGTHYLYDLLVRHPDCRPALRGTTWEGSWEDHLLHLSEGLSRYADLVVSTNRFTDARARPVLMRSLGAGLERFIEELDRDPGDSRRPVTKTPMTENLELFPQLFAGSTAVLLAREPSAVVSSAMRTFGGRADRWSLTWRDGARRFVRLLRDHPESAVLVRYEDLYTDTEATLRSLFGRLGLSADRYDFEGAGGLDVRGSSQLSDGAVHWLPTKPGPHFDPIGRGRSLSLRARQRLAWRALPEMEELGYPQDEKLPSGVLRVYHLGHSIISRLLREAVVLRDDIYDVRMRRDGRRWRRPPEVR